MSILEIIRLGNPILRQGGQLVTEAELASAPIQKLIDDMIETMRAAHGVGLAAPQVAASKRIIMIEVKGDNPRYPGQAEVPLTVIINPEILFKSEEMAEDWEGCLSIPNLRGRVPRHMAIKVSGLDRMGKPLNLEAKDFFARVIQHEVDHLEGKVFLDRMKDFYKYWNELKVDQD